MSNDLLYEIIKSAIIPILAALIPVISWIIISKKKFTEELNRKITRMEVIIDDLKEEIKSLREENKTNSTDIYYIFGAMKVDNDWNMGRNGNLNETNRK